MNKEIYSSPELCIITIENNFVRTSGEGEAPDVFEKDPFIEG